MLGKKGIVTREVVGAILGAAALLVLVIFFFKLVAPDFSVERETASSYLDSFNEALKELEQSGQEVFSPLVLSGRRRYFLVYFGNKGVVELEGAESGLARGEKISFTERIGKNKLCICDSGAGLDGGLCRVCENLDVPLRKVALENFGIAILLGDRIYLTKKEGYVDLGFLQGNKNRKPRACQVKFLNSSSFAEEEIVKSVIKKEDLPFVKITLCKDSCFLEMDGGNYSFDDSNKFYLRKDRKDTFIPIKEYEKAPEKFVGEDAKNMALLRLYFDECADGIGPKDSDEVAGEGCENDDILIAYAYWKRKGEGSLEGRWTLVFFEKNKQGFTEDDSGQNSGYNTFFRMLSEPYISYGGREIFLKQIPMNYDFEKIKKDRDFGEAMSEKLEINLSRQDRDAEYSRKFSSTFEKMRSRIAGSTSTFSREEMERYFKIYKFMRGQGCYGSA